MTRKFRVSALSASSIRRFRRIIWAHHRRHRRDFPWRRTSDPYRILVSEVMLQQTQADRVVPKYRQFIDVFPTIRSLAKAPLRDVLRRWQGLGYNRRALALKQLAVEVSQNFRGRIPDDREQLERLPGIGPYTAAAVTVFAGNQPQSLLETNIRSVFLHYFFPRRRLVHDHELRPLIARTLDRRQPRRWHEALMDYGAWLKKQLPNPGRRSRHYARQSQFDGSNRQLRGRLIRAVLDGPRSLNNLVQDLDQPSSTVRRALADLAREGLIARRGQTYIIH